MIEERREKRKKKIVETNQSSKYDIINTIRKISIIQI